MAEESNAFGGRDAAEYIINELNNEQIRNLIEKLTMLVETREALDDSRRQMRNAAAHAEALGAITKSVYSFQVQDPEPEVLTFGCIAYSLEDALELGEKAGHRELLLLEVRELTDEETDEFARAETLANPFLGAQWLPWIDAIAPALEDVEPGRSWTLDIAPAPYTWGVNGVGDTFFIQGINEADGSHHLEIGTKDLVDADNIEALQFLDFAGWKRPEGSIPIHHRVFEPGWNPRHVLYVAFQTLSVVRGVTPNDMFQPRRGLRGLDFDEAIFDSGLFDGPFQLESRSYALKGLHPLADEICDDETAGVILRERFGVESGAENGSVVLSVDDAQQTVQGGETVIRETEDSTNNVGSEFAATPGYSNLVWALSEAGIVIPPLGGVAPSEVLLHEDGLSGWHWSSKTPFDRFDTMYRFDVETVAHELALNGVRFDLSHGGHGANSYGLTLLVTQGSVAMLTQHAFGGAYSDALQTRFRINQTYARVRQLLSLVKGRPDASPAVLIAYSQFHGGFTFVDLDELREGKSFAEARFGVEELGDGVGHDEGAVFAEWASDREFFEEPMREIRWKFPPYSNDPQSKS